MSCKGMLSLLVMGSLLPSSTHIDTPKLPTEGLNEPPGSMYALSRSAVPGGPNGTCPRQRGHGSCGRSVMAWRTWLRGGLFDRSNADAPLNMARLLRPPATATSAASPSAIDRAGVVLANAATTTSKGT